MGQSLLPVTDPIPGYRFNVFLNDMIMGFQKVSGIGSEMETEVYREGGLNTGVHVFPKAFEKERTLRLEKGTCRGEGHLFCRVGARLEGPLNLVVMDHQGNPLKSYLFTGLVVKAWEVGELSAEQSGILTDRFEVSYESFVVNR